MRKLILVLAAVFVISISLFGCTDDRTVIVIENSRTDTTEEPLYSETAEQTDNPSTTDSTPPVYTEPEPESESAPEFESHDTDDTEIYSYVLNKNTKKFHYLSCSSVNEMKEKNKEFYSGTRDELLNRGFSPCGRCKP